MKKPTKPKKTNYKSGKVTISLPKDLFDFAVGRSAPPPYRGKFSKYIQALLEEDLQLHRKKWPVTERVELNEESEPKRRAKA